MPPNSSYPSSSHPRPDDSASRVPSRLLSGMPGTYARRHPGLSGAIPHAPRFTTPIAQPGGIALGASAEQHRATLRRRRLLAIFARMMAHFYDRHERRLSMGRYECSVCRQRIVAWAWLPRFVSQAAAMHEACVSRSMWEVVLYHEHLVRVGYAPDIGGLPRAGFAP